MEFKKIVSVFIINIWLWKPYSIFWFKHNIIMYIDISVAVGKLRFSKELYNIHTRLSDKFDNVRWYINSDKIVRFFFFRVEF